MPVPVVTPSWTGDILYDSMLDLQSKVQSIAADQNLSQVALCMGVTDLQEILTSGTPLPAVGIMYAGASSYYSLGGLHGAPKVSHNTGEASGGRFSVVLLTASKTVFGNAVDMKFPAMQALKAMRHAIFDTRGPSGKFWKFMAEVPAQETDEMLVWMQNWEVPLILD